MTPIASRMSNGFNPDTEVDFVKRSNCFFVFVRVFFVCFSFFSGRVPIVSMTLNKSNEQNVEIDNERNPLVCWS